MRGNVVVESESDYQELAAEAATFAQMLGRNRKALASSEGTAAAAQEETAR
ncbi:MAG: hypothetical protein WDN69_02525 [Aliidongia sp.]